MTHDSVVITLPSVLEPLVGQTRLTVSGSTALASLEAAFKEWPVLRHHIMADGETLRPHVICLLNGERLGADALRNTVVGSGDELTIFQAISGG